MNENMDCIGNNLLSGKEQLDRLNRKAIEQRIPLSGSIDLTHRCNMNCVHCYLGPHPGPQNARGVELGTEKLLSILDEITAAGCMNLLLTGGEPLVRRDFPRIYRRAKENGLLVTVFTNATLITDDILALFEKLPPHQVEITVYGATRPVYESITGVEGSFERSMAGIRKLLAIGLNVRLKTVIMSLNSHEFFAMQDIAETFGVKFRFDAAIFPRLNGERSPLELRVPAKEAVRLEFADGRRAQQWTEYYQRLRGLPLSDRLYHCGAGLSSFHIDPRGYLQPCLLTSEPRFSLKEGSFAEGWSNVIPRVRDIKAGAAYACNSCEKIGICGFCPAYFKMENGAGDARSDFICTMGALRYEAIQDIVLNGYSMNGSKK